MWIPNRSKPRWWCRLFHQAYWWSNDMGTWHTSGRRSFEVQCGRCGDCWTYHIGADGRLLTVGK